MDTNLEQVMKFYIDQLKNNPDLTTAQREFYESQIHRYTNAVISCLEESY